MGSTRPCTLYSNVGQVSMDTVTTFNYETLLGAVKSGSVPGNSDPDKAMKAVFDIAVAEDATQHRTVHVGPDMVKRLQGLRQSTDESLDKFRDVARGATVTN